MQLSNLFICGFEGSVLEKDTAEKLLELKPAGLILFDTNIKEENQLQKLITDLKDLLGEDIFISVDQEGGKVERLRKVSTSLPSLYALGSASQKHPEFLKIHTRIFASELVRLGFNLVFAPCLDLNTNPRNPIIGTRSLGVDAELISQQAQEIVHELNKFPLMNCSKHFPGHGDSSKDSHYALPYIDLGDEAFLSKHLKPFHTAINSGTDMIMTAHAVYKLPESIKLKPAFEKLPASINPYFVEELLQKELKFKGLCVTDEITMKALSQFGDYKRLCELMIKAGNDLIIWNTNIDEALAVERSSPSCHFSKSIREKIENSLAKIKQAKTNFKQRIQSPLPQITANAVNSLANIVTEAIQIKPSTQAFLDLLQSKGTKLKAESILVFKHPKLELDVIQQAFPDSHLIEFSKDTTCLKDLLLGTETNILILSFQCWSDAQIEKLILDLKKDVPNSLHVECDFDSEIADINLRGANLVHYESLSLKLNLRFFSL